MKKYRNETLLPQVINNVLNIKEDILFFTSYISFKDINKANEKGFLIIQLYCPEEILQYRNIHKDGGRISEMKKNIEYQEELKGRNLTDFTINCHKTPMEVYEDLLGILT